MVSLWLRILIGRFKRVRIARHIVRGPSHRAVKWRKLPSDFSQFDKSVNRPQAMVGRNMS
jgi:hypothetical protein